MMLGFCVDIWHNVLTGLRWSGVECCCLRQSRLQRWWTCWNFTMTWSVDVSQCWVI